MVLVTPFELHRQVEVHYGLPSGSLTWMGPFDPSTDPLWRELQAGRFSEPEYWRRRAERAKTERFAGRRGGLRDYMRVCDAGSADAFIRSQVEVLVAEARAAGLGTGILTNETELFHGREWVEQVPILQVVDVFVDASVTGILKAPRRFEWVAWSSRTPNISPATDTDRDGHSARALSDLSPAADVRPSETRVIVGECRRFACRDLRRRRP